MTVYLFNKQRGRKRDSRFNHTPKEAISVPTTTHTHTHTPFDLVALVRCPCPERNKICHCTSAVRDFLLVAERLRPARAYHVSCSGSVKQGFFYSLPPLCQEAPSFTQPCEGFLARCDNSLTLTCHVHVPRRDDARIF